MVLRYERKMHKQNQIICLVDRGVKEKYHMSRTANEKSKHWTDFRYLISNKMSISAGKHIATALLVVVYNNIIT